MPLVAQGDIFSLADSVDLLIVFGHRGFNVMDVSWSGFRARFPDVDAMGEPFTSFDADPYEYAPGKLIATVAGERSHGLRDAELRNIFNRLIDRTRENRIKIIATNGIANVDHGVNREADCASDDRRAQMLIGLAKDYEDRFRLKIILVSTDDVFIRQRQQSRRRASGNSVANLHQGHIMGSKKKGDPAEQKKIVKEIISELRAAIAEGRFNETVIRTATQKLAAQGYKYDANQFPPIASNSAWNVPTHSAPESLAEALLWKMGKWKIYKSFVEHYENAASKQKKTDVVFYAFAKHLKDSTKPIYDQHALRALWAVDSKLSEVQAKLFQMLLAKGSGKWKSIISGSKTVDGYLLYAERVTALCNPCAKLGDLDKLLGDLDKLLMPLGQAIKKLTDDITEFRKLIGERD